jgi:hypothetical protein
MAMIRSLSVAVLLAFGTIIAHAQGEENSLKGVPPSERMVFGGGMGLGFGSDQDYVLLSPSIGYMLTRKLMAGVNVTYQYNNYKFYRPSIKTHSYGGGPFARYMIFRGIFIHTEYEYLSYEFFESRKGYSSFMAGGGFIQPLGSKASFYFLALYNFLYETPLPGEFTPYNSPLVIRAGVSLGQFGLF